MATFTTNRHFVPQPLAFVLRVGIVVLALATAQIHATLGGLMFTLNAIGYATLAVAMVLPGQVGRIRWLTRYALIGFTAATIIGWLAFGARFDLAYVDKAIEAALIGLLLIESWAIDGGPLAVARRARGDVAALLG
ncbi:MAG TPA: hypothetical protein VGQ02_09050 [Candidatus Limnocylindrales bacterium]|jgi:hypothetical protein|nr:hypothetical protein [Candidatus Limnocylindrales bacterium]